MEMSECSRRLGLDVRSETGGRLIPCRAQKLENELKTPLVAKEALKDARSLRALTKSRKLEPGKRDDG